MQSLLQSGDQQTIFLLCRGGEELYVLEVYLCDKDIPKVVAKHYLPVEDAMLDFMASNEFLDMTEFCELDIDLQQLLSIPENIVEGRDETRTPNSFLSDYSGLSRLPSPRPVTSDSLTSLSESLKNLLRNDGDQLYQGIVKGVNSRPATAISLMRISPEAKPLLIIPKSRPASAKEWITGLKSQLETGFEEYNEIELLPAISQSSKIPVSPLKRSALNKDDDLKYFSSDPTHDSVFSTTGTAKIKTTGLIVSSSIVCKNKRRSCYVCNKKLGPAQIFHCKCKSSLCATHRYSDRHSCMFDYKTDAKPGLLKNNPTVKKEKLLRI